MNSHPRWAHFLVAAGAIAMLLGSLDPLEGSLLILPGSGLVALGAFLGGWGRPAVRYWSTVFILIAVGVVAMFVLSAFGGIGGSKGQSIWWGIFLLPYPAGWLMAFAGAILALFRWMKKKVSRATHSAAQPR